MQYVYGLIFADLVFLRCFSKNIILLASIPGSVDHNMAGSSVTLCAEKLFKVLVIGDLGVGKSSIILRYTNKNFDEGYKASIGVDFALKTIEWDAKTVVRLQLWDIAGECNNYEVSVADFCKQSQDAIK